MTDKFSHGHQFMRRIYSSAWPWLLAAAALVLFRTLPYAWWGTLAFDADQAVVGLMAKHIAEFRALPFYQYGLSYVLMVSAYITAPFMWVFGPTPFALKLPLVLINVGVGTGLVLLATRAGLRPRVALVLSLPVLMTSGVANAGLMDALGMTVEPAAFVLALWALRGNPLYFGIVAAVGFHVREFVAYAVAAVVAIDVLAGQFTSREGGQAWMVAGMSMVGTSAVLAGMARFASPSGPDTWVSSSGDNLATLGGAFCFAPTWALANVVDLGRSYLGLLWGASPVPLAEVAVQTHVTQGVAWGWPLLAAVLLVTVFRLASRWRTVWAHRHDPIAQLGAFLMLVGLQSVLVYAVSRCGPLSLLTVRYALLGVFLPTGIALMGWVVEPRRGLRHATAAAFIALAALNAWPHLRLWQEQWAHPSTPNRAQLGAALEARGIRYVRSDYWTAYYVAFITRERVVVGADTLSRIDEYERALARHASEVVRVSTAPCGDLAQVVPGYYLCQKVVP